MTSHDISNRIHREILAKLRHLERIELIGKVISIKGKYTAFMCTSQCTMHKSLGIEHFDFWGRGRLDFLTLESNIAKSENVNDSNTLNKKLISI